MAHWKDVLWKACEKAYLKGGEVTIIFVKRAQKRIPIVKAFIDNRVQCDEETIIDDE